jgi:hypothetical protein
MQRYDEYKRLLAQVADHLRSYDDRRWPAVLGEWLKEISGEGIDVPHAHLERTRRALAGMGSIADVVICPQAGHRISSNESEIRKANARLLQLVHDLHQEVEKLLVV